jgi:hypothetical protein
MNILEFALQTVIPYTVGSAFQAMQLPETRTEAALDVEPSEGEAHSTTSKPASINSNQTADARSVTSGGQK